ncbi:amino acid permease [bacterium]|nr:amino acid permease [bacterium]
MDSQAADQATDSAGKGGKGGLSKSLGFFSLALFGIGMIIGAGVYSIIGAAAGEALDGLWLSFLAGAFAALLTGLSYAELSTAIPRTGAEFTYLRMAAPSYPLLGGAVGYLLVFSTCATAATVALAFAGYMQLFSSLPAWLSAAGLLILCGLISIWGIKHSTWVNAILTLTELAGLFMVVVVGWDLPAFSASISAELHPGIFAGAALIFFVYLGFEDIANLSEEAREPGRDLPRAILVALAVTSVLYVLVALAVVNLLSPAELAQSQSPLAAAVAAEQPGLRGWVGIIALVSTANTALIASIISARMLFSMARSGAAPAALSRLAARRRTPWLASIVVFALALLFLPFGKAATTASFSSFAALIAFGAVNAAAIRLRYSHPQLERPFRIPLSIGRFPLPAALGLLTVLALLTQFNFLTYAVGLAALATALLLLHFLPGRKSEEAGAGREEQAASGAAAGRP